MLNDKLKGRKSQGRLRLKSRQCVVAYQEPIAGVNYCMLFSASALKTGAEPCIRVPLVAVSRNYLKG